MDGAYSIGGGGMGDMEASFKAFLQRPENKAFVEEHQRKEAEELYKAQDEDRSRAFQQEVLRSGHESQKHIAQYLAIPALRRVISTFQNNKSGQFADWSTNPQVLEMLAGAKRMLDAGHITHEQLDRSLTHQLQVAAEGDAAVQQQMEAHKTVRLPLDQLVGALNEHLTERRQGNEKYKAGDLEGAVYHYERALAIVEYVRGMSPTEQEEVDNNWVAVLLNLAAVAMTRCQFGLATDICDKALQLQPKNTKALLRRAKALMGRHEYQGAQHDIERVMSLQPDSAAAQQLLEELQHARKRQALADSQLAAKMLHKT